MHALREPRVPSWPSVRSGRPCPLRSDERKQGADAEACALRWPDSVLRLVACYRVARTAQLDLLKVEVIVDTRFKIDMRFCLA